MFAALIYADQPCGIIFIGEKNQLAGTVADELHKLGLLRSQSGGIFTPEVRDALNSYRRANSLPESDYCDPVTLRLLTGIESGGEELLLLARYLESEYPAADEVERFDRCREALSGADRLGLGLKQYLSGKCQVGALLSSPAPSAETVKAAVLAYMLGR